MRRYIESIGIDEVLRAMGATRDKFSWVNTKPVRYFFGICKHTLAELEGRSVACIYCRKKIALDPGEDPSGEWYHVFCKKEAEAA